MACLLPEERVPGSQVTGLTILLAESLEELDPVDIDRGHG